MYFQNVHLDLLLRIVKTTTVGGGGVESPNSIMVMVAELYKYVKNHCTVYLKLVHFIVCKLHINKTVNKRFSNSIFVALISFLGSKITADGDCSHEIKICLLHRKKSYDQTRKHIKKQRHYFCQQRSI